MRVRPIAIRLQRTTSHGILSLSVLMLTGCTLLDLEEIEPPVCDCEALNERETTDCRRWKCPTDGWKCQEEFRDDDGDGYLNPICSAIDGIEERFGRQLDCDDSNKFINPDATEECDLIDNDCDGSTDEELFTSQQIELADLPVTSIDSETCLADDTFQLSVSSTQPSPYLGIVKLVGKRSYGWMASTTSIPSSREFERLDYFSVYDNTNEANRPEQCPIMEKIVDDPNFRYSVKKVSCDFRQLAFDAVDQYLITASVNGVECRLGELRIGFEHLISNRIHLGKSTVQNDVRFGVEGNQDLNHCDHNGVHHPVIATMSSNQRRQALVVWLNESYKTSENLKTEGRTECGQSTEVSMRALGLLFGSTNPNEDLPELEASDEGAPVELANKTTSVSAPSLISWQLDDSSGYLLAYSNQKRKLKFAIFPALRIVTGANSFHLPQPDVYPQQDEEGDPIEHVAVALETPPVGNFKRVSLLAAYRTGCGAESRVGFAVFDIEEEADTNSGISLNNRSSGDLSVSNGGTVVEGPEVVFSDRDFCSPSGSDSVESIGGWTVVWTERRNEKVFLLASRVSVLDDNVRILNKTPVELAQGELSSPVAFTDQNGSVFFAAIDHCLARPIWGRTYCECK